MLGQRQALSISEALAGFTVEAARADGDGDERGTVEVGKAADLVVLSVDPFGAPIDQLRHNRVLMTMVSGRIVHAIEGFAGLTDQPG